MASTAPAVRAASRRARRLVWCALLLLATLPWRPRPAAAIPVFAYVYDKPCSACHTVYPQLNPAGERFSNKGMHGYVPAVKPIALGPYFALPGTVPLAISAGVGEDLSGATEGSGDRFVEHLNLEYLGILAGSELGPHLSFLADYAPLLGSPTTGETRTNTRLGLGFLQAHAEPWELLGNLKVGLQELPLGASPRVHRLSTQGYLIYQVTPASLLAARAPTTGLRKETLSLASTQYALELSVQEDENGLGGFLGGSLGSNNKDDLNSAQDVFARVQQGFGAASRAGMFVYYSPDTVGPGVTNQALRVGPDVTLYDRSSRLVAQFLAGWDSNPTGVGEELWYYGGFLEGNYRLTPELMAIARFDAVGTAPFDDTDRGGSVAYQPFLWSTTAGLQYLLDEGLKVLVEGTYGETSVIALETGDRGALRTSPDGWLVTVQLRTAFFPLRPPFYHLLFPDAPRGGGA